MIRRILGIASGWLAWILFLTHLFLPTLSIPDTPWFSPGNLFGGETIYFSFVTPVSFLWIAISSPSIETLFYVMLAVFSMTISLDNLLLATAPLYTWINSRKWLEALFLFTLAFTILAGLFTLIGHRFVLSGHYTWMLSNILLLVSSYISYKDEPGIAETL